MHLFLLASCLLPLAGCAGQDPADGKAPDDTAPVSGVDADGDGFVTPDDCDDADPAINSAASEVCDAGDIDENCNGVADDSDPTVTDSLRWYEDGDGDGYGPTDARPSFDCDPPEGSADNTEDCDDLDAAISPSAPELCDEAGVDEDCDGLVNNDDPDLASEGLGTFYLDEDRDDYGDAATTTTACVTPAGYADVAGDCDDTDRDINPGGVEICDNGIDEDCTPGGGGCGVWGTTDLSTRSRAAKLTGESAGDGLADTRPARDLDGDGYDDLLVGSAAAEGGAAGSGEAYVLYGPLSGRVRVQDADVRVPGAGADDALVPLMAGVDADGDRAPDLLVGAPGYGADSGRVYLVGGAFSATEEVSAAPIDWVGDSASDAFGRLGGYGDFDGDRYEDLVFCGADTIWVFDGPAPSLAAQPAGYADAIFSLGSVGSLDVYDFDGDGMDDLLVGDPSDSGGAASAGAARIVYGPLGGVAPLASVAEVVFEGSSAGQGVGSAVAGGDVDGDGYKDVVLGASMDGAAASEAGAVYLSFGRFASEVDLATAVVLTGVSAGDHAGASLGLGDFDGDGVTDLIVGASGDDEGGSEAGAAYVVYGPIEASGSLADADAKLVGEDAGDAAGAAVGRAGDIDGDGIDDLFVSAPGDDEGGSDAGAIYLFGGGGE
ncbi:MAG: MopE-related protein [Pseudomonadota bacterium]|nr:MopE-related protein [Pseudomonadota bacterium]